MMTATFLLAAGAACLAVFSAAIVVVLSVAAVGWRRQLVELLTEYAKLHPTKPHQAQAALRRWTQEHRWPHAH